MAALPTFDIDAEVLSGFLSVPPCPLDEFRSVQKTNMAGRSANIKIGRTKIYELALLVAAIRISSRSILRAPSAAHHFRRRAPLTLALSLQGRRNLEVENGQKPVGIAETVYRYLG